MPTQVDGITTYRDDTLPLLMVQNKDQPCARLEVIQGAQNYTQECNLNVFFHVVNTVYSNLTRLLRPQEQLLSVGP